MMGGFATAGAATLSAMAATAGTALCNRLAGAAVALVALVALSVPKGAKAGPSCASNFIAVPFSEVAIRVIASDAVRNGTVAAGTAL